MKQLIDYFDTGYVINLEDRFDRREEVKHEFLRIDVNFPNDKVHLYGAKRLKDKGTFPDVGTRGNFTSHLDVLRLASRENARNVLIFEDDVSFRDVDTSVVTQIVESLRVEDWDIVLFGYLAPAEDGLSGPLAPWAADIMGAHFYAVNGRFIPRMIEFMSKCEFRPAGHPEGGPMTADGAYNHVRYIIPNIRLLLAVPNLAHQRASRTDLHPTGILDRIVALRPLLRSARAVKHKLRMTADKRKLRRQHNG